LSVCVAVATAGEHVPTATLRPDLRSDGVPVLLLPPGALEAEYAAQMGGSNVSGGNIRMPSLSSAHHPHKIRLPRVSLPCLMLLSPCAPCFFFFHLELQCGKGGMRHRTRNDVLWTMMWCGA
jgi:hypothetical protein